MIREAAYKWWQHGFNVVPVKFFEDKKQPLGDWARWHSKRQSEKDFNDLPWGSAEGFGIVTDYPNNEGLFLAVVDYDVKRVSEEAKAKGKELLGKFPITRMEKTATGGIHLVYLSKVKPKAVREFHDSHALELIAGGLLAVMAPSKGYTILNDNEPTILEDAQGIFYQVLGVNDDRAEVNEGVDSSLLEKWLSQIKAKLKVAGEGHQYIYAHCPFHPPDKHPSFAIHKTKYYAVDFHDNQVYNLRQLARALGVELDGVPEGLTCKLGAYRLNLVERDVFLLDFKDQPVFTCKLHALNSEKTKTRLAELTGVDKADVERKVAEFTFKAHVMQNSVRDEQPTILMTSWKPEKRMLMFSMRKLR